jgi:Protein of unknown function (DUF2690)
MQRNRALAATVGALALAATSAIGLAAPAHAADLNDPFASGCSKDAYPVGPSYIAVGSPNTTGVTGFGQLNLMYSPACNTNWAELGNYPQGFKFALAVWSNDNNPAQDVRWTSNGDELAWTDMVSGASPAGAGVCEDSASSGAVLRTAWMSQQSSNTFQCNNGQGWGIGY